MCLQAASAGSQSVTVWGGDMSQTASSSFNYDESLTPLIDAMSPEKTTVIGEFTWLAFHPPGTNIEHRFISLGSSRIPGSGRGLDMVGNRTWNLPAGGG